MIARTEISPIDFKAVQEKLKEDNKFLSEILKILPNVKSSDDGAEEESPYLFSHSKSNRKPSLEKEKTDRAKSLEELHARLSELKGKKLDYKDKLMKKKLKNQMKKKKRSKDLGMKRTLIKLPKSEKEEILGLANGAASHKPSKPVFNSAGKMVFSKFDFRSDEIVGDSGMGSKGKKKEDPKKLMERLKKERQEEKAAGEDGIGESEKKNLKSWASVLARSRGEKVLDDPELLKKSINRAESKKRSNQKKWKEREERVIREKEERQAKRTAAISAKKKEKKTKKLKKAAKKGRIIPGFS